MRRAAEAAIHEFPEGLWLDIVMESVAEGGALKDIFPSLHTAAPTFILLYSFRHRHRAPYRYTWPLVAFFTVNIIVATMFLRWHWIVDVVAGLTLATVAQALSARVTRWERRGRWSCRWTTSCPTSSAAAAGPGWGRTRPSPSTRRRASPSAPPCAPAVTRGGRLTRYGRPFTGLPRCSSTLAPFSMSAVVSAKCRL